MGSKILNVPYKCQNDPDANLKRTDCGPCCIAMILGGLGQQVTTNAVVAAANQQGDNGLMQSQVISAARAFGLEFDWGQGYSLDDLKKFLDNGQPPIALVKYANLPERVDKNSTGGHYVVVVGYDDATQRIFINDPDYFPGTSGGYQKAYAYPTWMSAWGGFAAGENVNFSLVFPKKVGLIGGEGTAAVQPSAQPSGDVYVIAPAGLLLRNQPNAGAGASGGVVFGQHLTALGAESVVDGTGRSWQQVKTDAGVVAFVAASLSGDRLLTSTKPADPYVVQVIDSPTIRDAAGLAVRDARNIALNPLDRVQPNERMTVYQRVVESDGSPWLWVLSPRGQYGWSREAAQGQTFVNKITPDLSGASVSAATPEPPTRNPPPPMNVAEVWISTSDGLFLRQQASKSAQPVMASVLLLNTHLTTIGPTVGPDAANIVWQQVKTDDGKQGWVAVQIDGAATVTTAQPVTPPVINAVPWGKCLAGLGMGNPQPLTPGQLLLVGKAQLEAFKTLTLPDPDENTQLIAQLKNIRSDMFIVTRLFFSVDVGSKNKFSPQNFVDFVNNGLTACYQAGVRYFEVHNEPNLEVEGMNWNWANGAEFGNWLQQVLNILKPRFPDAKWGYPGLSPQPNVDSFLDGSAAAANACDWIGVHCYWQQPPYQPPFPIDGNNAGMYWRAKFRPRFADKMLMITEFSNNTAAVAAGDKAAQYADYIKALRTELNVGAAFSFALNWPGQDKNREGWEINGSETAIPGTFGALITQAGFLA